MSRNVVVMNFRLWVILALRSQGTPAVKARAWRPRRKLVRWLAVTPLPDSKYRNELGRYRSLGARRGRRGRECLAEELLIPSQIALWYGFQGVHSIS